jgi:hypothetical protein
MRGGSGGGDSETGRKANGGQSWAGKTQPDKIEEGEGDPIAGAFADPCPAARAGRRPGLPVRYFPGALPIRFLLTYCSLDKTKGARPFDLTPWYCWRARHDSNMRPTDS